MGDNYAREVDRLRVMSKENVKRVTVSKDVDSVLARGVTGWVMGYRENRLKVFTGIRYWFIPEEQCELVIKKVDN